MPKNGLTIQDMSLLALIAEAPEIPRQAVNEVLRGLNGEAKRVGTAMQNRLHGKQNGAKSSTRSSQSANAILKRAETNGFVKREK